MFSGSSKSGKQSGKRGVRVYTLWKNPTAGQATLKRWQTERFLNFNNCEII